MQTLNENRETAVSVDWKKRHRSGLTIVEWTIAACHANSYDTDTGIIRCVHRAKSTKTTTAGSNNFTFPRGNTQINT
jgi:hypothetical protein